MRRLAALFVLIAASPGLRADPAETPFLILREPDAETAREITRDLVTEKGLGGDKRRETRERLARIGPWCVPYLATALRKESSARIRMNAAFALALIRDPRGLPALREAAAKDDNLWVRRAATLAVPLFEWKADLETLEKIPKARAEWRSMAPALARLRHAGAKEILGNVAKKLPSDEHDAAAIVLSAAIAGADLPFVELLEDRRKLVQEAAAAGLAVRPLPPERAGEILAALDRSRMGKDARVVAVRALGAIDPRPDAAQAALVKIACGDGEAAERIAALLELRGTPEEFDPLWKAYRQIAGRNDPVVGALLLALARTREGKATEVLIDATRTGSPFVRFYAGAALLDVNGSAQLPEDTRKAVTALKEVRLCEPLATLAQGMASGDEATRRAAAGKLKLVDDPRHLKLSLGREERNWLEANRVLTKVFELGTVLLQFDTSARNRTAESPLPGAGGEGDEGKKQSTASDEQQDLFDLLIPWDYPERKPYFGPGDLARG